MVIFLCQCHRVLFEILKFATLIKVVDHIYGGEEDDDWLVPIDLGFNGGTDLCEMIISFHNFRSQFFPPRLSVD